MKKYIEKETKEEWTLDEIQRDYNEIVHNSSYSDDEISLMGSFQEFLNEYYEDAEE